MASIEVGMLQYAAYSYLFLRVIHLQRTLSCFTHNTLIEVAILFPGHSYYTNLLACMVGNSSTKYTSYISSPCTSYQYSTRSTNAFFCKNTCVYNTYIT